MSVKFDNLNEYFEEMERDAMDDLIKDHIVRTTVNSSTTLTRTAWISSTVIGYHARGELVTCQIARGDRPFEGKPIFPAEMETMANLDRDIQALANFCVQHGLDLRGGRFE